MISKMELFNNPKLQLVNGGGFINCDNPNCDNAYHFMKEFSYSVLNQEREDGLIVDFSFCSMKCLTECESKIIEMAKV